jgi:putative ABC transport system permease protein
MLPALGAFGFCHPSLAGFARHAAHYLVRPMLSDGRMVRFPWLTCYALATATSGREVRDVGPRWTKVYRDLLAHKLRTILVVLSIAVGIFAVSVMMGGRAVLIRSVDESFPQTSPPSVTYLTTPFDEHLVRSVELDHGVAAAQARHVAELAFRVNGGPWQNGTFYAFKRYEDIAVGKLDLPRGESWPQRGEMLIERGSVEFSGLKTGDLVELETSDKKHPVLRVSGTVHDLNAVVPMMTGRAVAYINWDSLADLGEPASFNQLDVVASGRPTTLAQVTALGVHLRDDVIQQENVRVVRMSAHKPGVQNLADIFKAISLLLVVVGVLTLFLSGFLVVNTIGALVTQQTRQIGVMKAVGALSGQLVGMYFVMVLSYGLMGLAVAIPLGQLATNWFVNFGSSKLNFLVSDYSLPPAILTIELAVGLLVPLAAATVPVVLGMRMPVRQALYSTGTSAAEFGEGLLDRLLGRVRALPRPVALALRNTFLRKGRLALTLITLTLAAAVFIAVASVRTSIFRTVDLVGQHRNMDIWGSLYPAQPLADVTREALSVPGVTGIEGWITRSGIRLRPDGSESPAMVVDGVPPDTRYLHAEMKAGRWLLPGDTNAVVVDTGVLKSDPDIQVGGLITIKIGNVEQMFRVVGIARGDLLNPFVYVSRDYLDTLLSAKGGVETIMVGTAQHDAESQSNIARDLTDRFSAKQMRVTDTLTQRSLQKTIADSLGIIVVFLVIMAALLATVGGIGISGTMSINVLESTREIGVMRAIGASNGAIYQIFIAEGIVVGLMSWAFGAVVSVPLSWALTTALGDAMAFPLSFSFSPGGVVAWLGFVVAISVLASLLPAYRAARVSVAEAIAYE